MKLVRVRSFQGSLGAEMAKLLLESQDIPCVLQGGVSAAYLPMLEVALLVREEDAERAREILKGYLESAGPIPVE